jgi:protein SCO1/2
VRPAGWRGIVAGAMAALGGVLLVGLVTEGFTVVTTEGARRRAVRRAPPLLPAAIAHTTDGRRLDALADDGIGGRGSLPRAAIVTFIYTRCPGVCGVLGESMQRLQRLVRERGLADRVRLVALSFDAAHDTPDELARYARLRRADPAIWQLRVLTDSASRAALLGAAGIVVIPDGASGWQHNAALLVVSPDRRLVRVLDLDDVEGALAAVADLAPSDVVARR